MPKGWVGDSNNSELNISDHSPIEEQLEQVGLKKKF